MDVVVLIYELTSHFPKVEIYALALQMKKAAVSIPSNIAEGSKRATRKDYRHFLLNAFGSGAELETQILIAQRLEFAKSSDYSKVNALLDEVMKMLNKMSNELG